MNWLVEEFPPGSAARTVRVAVPKAFVVGATRSDRFVPDPVKANPEELTRFVFELEPISVRLVAMVRSVSASVTTNAKLFVPESSAMVALVRPVTIGAEAASRVEATPPAVRITARRRTKAC